MSLSRYDESNLKGIHEEVIGIDEVKLIKYATPELSKSKALNILTIQIIQAGRGPLAGPVVAASCVILDGVEIDGINDSKTTSELDRERVYEILTKHKSVVWGVSIVDHKVIDEINILQATLQAMRESCAEVLHKLKTKKKSLSPKNLIALIDGNKIPADMPVESKFVIKGDSYIFSIAAASIIAKVTRDRLMVELDKKHPLYGFAKHKGYPTAEHRAALYKFGPSSVHRLTYSPVKASMKRFVVDVEEGLRTPPQKAIVKRSRSPSPTRDRHHAGKKNTVDEGQTGIRSLRRKLMF